MERFRHGDKIVVDNEELKTHGCKGIIINRHYNDYRWGCVPSESYDVILDYKGGKLPTFIKDINLKLIPNQGSRKLMASRVGCSHVCGALCSNINKNNGEVQE